MRTCALIARAAALVVGSLCSVVACGGGVDVDPGAGGGGAGGSGEGGSGSGSGGGIGGGGSSVSVGSSSSGVGGGAPEELCGGIAGATCPPDAWCDYPDEQCGGDDGTGVCKPRPEVCDGGCPGVCGCDGAFYCNACSAQAAGVDTSGVVDCSPVGAYSAEAFFGGLDHIVLRKADTTRNLCVMLYLDRPTESTPGFAFDLPEEWGVSHAEVTNQASDCDKAPPPLGESFNAMGGQGNISFTMPPNGFFPCSISVKGALTFAPGPDWTPKVEPLEATEVKIKNGCL